MTSNDEPQEIGLLPALTLVMWLGCLAVGAAGMLISPPRPTALSIELPPVQARLINVNITRELLPAPSAAPQPAEPFSQPPIPIPPQPPALPDISHPSPTAPPMIALEKLPPMISFPPLPATPTPPSAPATQPAIGHQVPRSAAAAPPPTPQIQQLTYGQGDGQQPAPEYPREAALAHQQGTVVVLFTVAPGGAVLSARASVPCSFPLLNQAAVRAVRETWRFRAGPSRTFEVSIHFQLD